MNPIKTFTVGLVVSLCLSTCFAEAQQAIIINHTTTKIRQIPEAAILQAKSTLHIAYGHTSHGSQLTEGMTGLVAFMNGLGYPEDLYAWNGDGSGGALHLRDYYGDFPGASDLGEANTTDQADYAWYQATRNFLNTPANSAVNVVIWSWCGGVSRATEDGIDMYLSLMNQLETDFPDVRFVYMTGHLDGSGADGNLNLRNQQIRDYAVANHKILYDFADIESYDPDGQVHYMPLLANDNCDYDSDGNGSQESNWATAWQDAYIENTDWYDCGAAHSQSLNANLKAYAAWWLWTRLAGWNGDSGSQSYLLWTK